MDGNEFREKREAIERVIEEINILTKKKLGMEADKKIEKFREMIDELTLRELSDIQKTSLFNLRIKMGHLVESVDKINPK
jgi:hypothetical protein